MSSIIINSICIFILTIGIAVFLHYFYFPYIKRKRMWKDFSHKMDDIAKNEDISPESKKALKELSDGFRQLARGETIFEEEE